MSTTRTRRISLLFTVQGRAYARWQASPEAWGGTAYRRYLAASDLLSRVLDRA